MPNSCHAHKNFRAGVETQRCVINPELKPPCAYSRGAQALSYLDHRTPSMTTMHPTPILTFTNLVCRYSEYATAFRFVLLSTPQHLLTSLLSPGNGVAHERLRRQMRPPRVRLREGFRGQNWGRECISGCPLRGNGRRHGRMCRRSPNPSAFLTYAVDSQVWMSHGDQLSAPPPDFHTIARTPTAPFAAIAHATKPFYGIQFHPEVTHSPRGKEVIAGFVLRICGCKTNWTMVRSGLSARSSGPLTKGKNRKSSSERKLPEFATYVAPRDASLVLSAAVLTVPLLLD